MPEGSGAFLLPMLIIVAVRHGATSNPWSRRTEGRRPWRRHPLRRQPMNRGWPAGGPSRETYPRHAGHSTHHQRREVSAVSLRRCAWHNCPQLVPQGTRFCKAHAHAYETRRGTSGQRGYGAAHRRERARWQAAMDSGVVPVCAKCNQPVLPSQAWDLGHTDDRKAWTGPEHRSCNRRDGQHKAISHQEHWH